jgi:hypothetical protein
VDERTDLMPFANEPMRKRRTTKVPGDEEDAHQAGLPASWWYPRAVVQTGLFAAFSNLQVHEKETRPAEPRIVHVVPGKLPALSPNRAFMTHHQR